MKKNLKAVFFCSVFTWICVNWTHHVYSQSLNDTLSRILKNKKTDTLQINKLNRINGTMLHASPGTSINISRQVYVLSVKGSYKKGMAQSFENMGDAYSILNQKDSAITYLINSLKIYESSKNMRGMSAIYNKLGMLSFKAGKYEEGLAYFNKSLESLHKSGDEAYSILPLHNIGTIYKVKGDQTKALQYFLKAMESAQKANNNLEVEKLLSDIGMIAFEHNLYDKSLFYFRKALVIGETLKEKSVKADIYLNIGNVYAAKNDSNLALRHFKRALDTKILLDDKKGMSNVYHSMGVLYFNAGHFNTALRYHKMALKLRESIEDQEGIAETSERIGDIYLKMKNFEAALEYINHSLAISQSIGADPITKNSYLSLAQKYAAEKKYREAFEYMTKYSVIKDSLNSKQNRKDLAALEFRYNFNQQQKIIDNLQKEKIIKNLEVTRANIIRNFTILISILFLIIWFIIFQRYRSRKHTNEILQAQKSQIEHKNQLLENVNEDLSNKNVELETALKDKEILFKEVHHRVKNNLQIISSLFNLQKRYISDPNVMQAVIEAQSRIKSISLIHQNLYQMDNISEINFSNYINQLVTYLYEIYNVSTDQIPIEFNIAHVVFDIDKAIPLGLIFNELLSNALKYAFPTENKGIIKVSLSQRGDEFEFRVSDNGVGFKEAMDPDKVKSLGLKLVKTLVNQLGGTFEIVNSAGVETIIRFNRELDASFT